MSHDRRCVQLERSGQVDHARQVRTVGVHHVDAEIAAGDRPAAPPASRPMAERVPALRRRRRPRPPRRSRPRGATPDRTCA
jgi:hypothetical protein